MVFVSNGYNGQWQIEKNEPVRGFSLYYETLPIIVIKKCVGEFYATANYFIPIQAQGIMLSHHTVKKLDALQTQTKKLETLYQQKINNLVELKKSVLQKAFAGELT
jgi:hypothetical protein